MNIVILTSLQPQSIYMVNRIVKESNVVGRVIENRGLVKMEKRDKWTYWNGIRKRYGPWKAIDRYLFLKCHSRFFHENEEKAKISVLFPDGEEIAYNDNITTIEVGSINDEKARRFISDLSPDLICVCGTSLIKPYIFNLPKYGSINSHMGITPEYRGSRTVEWALYNRDYDNVGVTVHFVDKGADTGDIIFQERIPIEKRDNLGAIQARCKIVQTRLMLKAISDIENGTVKRWRKDHVRGRNHISHQFGLSIFLRTLLNLKTKR